MKSNYNPSYVDFRHDLIAHINGKNMDVLDVGCATGTNGKYLLDQGMARSVVGIEFDEEMASDASHVYDKVIVGNLDHIETLEELGDKMFDCVLLGDVLEHLVNPPRVLSTIAKHLRDNGILIISVPNIQHIDVFIHIFIKGTWPRNERGIFDKTHLKNFTLKDLKLMVNDSGLDVVKIDRNYRARDKPKSKFHPFYYAFRYIFKRFYTFQLIAVCKRKKS